MKSTLAALSFLSLLALATTANAECTYPKPPDVMPDAATATKEAMVAAAGLYKQYNLDVDAYVVCLDAETADKVKEVSGVMAIIQVKSIQAKKKASATEERVAKIEEFNKQIRTFKAKG